MATRESVRAVTKLFRSEVTLTPSYPLRSVVSRDSSPLGYDICHSCAGAPCAGRWLQTSNESLIQAPVPGGVCGTECTVLSATRVNVEYPVSTPSGKPRP